MIKLTHLEFLYALHTVFGPEEFAPPSDDYPVEAYEKAVEDGYAEKAILYNHALDRRKFAGTIGGQRLKAMSKRWGGVVPGFRITQAGIDFVKAQPSFDEKRFELMKQHTGILAENAQKIKAKMKERIYYEQ